MNVMKTNSDRGLINEGSSVGYIHLQFQGLIDFSASETWARPVPWGGGGGGKLVKGRTQPSPCRVTLITSAG